jgi:hypothetical protein
MIDRNSEFFRISKEIAADFLQSTVIIDDYETPGSPSSGDLSLVEPRAGHRPPIGGKTPLAQPGALSPEESENVESEADHTSNPYFDDKAVVRAFAKRGIVCSVINPAKTETDTLTELISDLADCADITVIDWSLHGDNGDKAKEIITSILRQDKTRPAGRLRLLAIYTGNNEIISIAPMIKQRLEEELPYPVEVDPDGFSLSHGATRIVILAKPEYTKIPSEYHHRIVEFDKLAERLTDEFAQMTAGLVSNVVVSAFSTIRKNTYRVLSRFSENLDPPYLSHRFMLPEPHDAETYISALVASELQTLLEEAKIGRNADLDAIRAWFNAKNFQGFTLDYASDKQQKFSFDDVLLILDSGLENFKGLSGKNRARLDEELHTKPMTLYFSNGREAASALDERFAAISLMRSHYEESAPVLTLGTIIKEVCSDESYFFVCAASL